MEKFCKNCNKTFSKNENYCVTCGSKLLSVSSEYNQVKREVTLRLANELIKGEDGTMEGMTPDQNLLMKKMREIYKNLPPEFKRLLELILNIPDRDKSAELVTKCFNSILNKDRKMQIEYVQETADFYPDNKFLWNFLEGGYMSVDDLSGASKCLERQITIDPNDGEAWGRLGSIYSLRVRRIHKLL